MKQSIGHVTLLVPDYDEAIAWFTQILNFSLIEDGALGAGRRWVVVEPAGSGGTRLVLAEPADERQAARIGTRRAAACSCSCAPTIFSATIRR